MSAPRTFKKDATSKSIYVVLYDSTTFLPKTGLVYTDITGSYVRVLGSRVAVTMATLAATTTAYSSGGFKEIDATNEPGLYRFDVPDAVIATGVDEATITLKATGVVTDHTLIYLTAYDPNAAGAETATIADAVWDEARAGHVTAGSFGEYVFADAMMISADATAANNLESMLDGTGSVTLSAILGSNAITATSIATGAIQAAKIDADAIGATQIATGALTAAKFAASAITSTVLAADAITAAKVASDVSDEIAAAVWNIADAEETALPAANATFRDKLNFMFALVRNKMTFNKTTGVATLRNDADGASIAAHTDTDDGTTYTRAEWT